jgi:hypothetical protein
MRVLKSCTDISGASLKIRDANSTGSMGAGSTYIFFVTLHPSISLADFVKKKSRSLPLSG